MEFLWFRGEPVWQLAQLEPALHAYALQLVPEMAGLEADLKSHFPAQRQPLPGHWAPYHRPRGHWRAFYYAIANHSHLAIKGSEACAEDFSALLDTMSHNTAQLRYSLSRPGAQAPWGQALVSILERFLYVENKLPALVTLPEAISEANKACQFQVEYRQHYGRLARVPLPWMVHRVESERCQSLVEEICQRCPSEHHARVRCLAAAGLAILVYWYPGLPLRAAHLPLPPVSPEFTLAQRIAALSHGTLPEQVAGRWIELLSDTLCLGYVPTDPRAALQGLCLEAHNLTLDGGMVDLDSLRKMDSFRHPAEVQLALERSFEVMSQSLSEYLLGARAQPGPSQRMACAAVRQQVLAHCLRQRDQGRVLAEPLARLLEADSAYRATLLSLESHLHFE